MTMTVELPHELSGRKLVDQWGATVDDRGEFQTGLVRIGDSETQTYPTHQVVGSAGDVALLLVPRSPPRVCHDMPEPRVQ